MIVVIKGVEELMLAAFGLHDYGNAYENAAVRMLPRFKNRVLFQSSDLQGLWYCTSEGLEFPLRIYSSASAVGSGSMWRASGYCVPRGSWPIASCLLPPRSAAGKCSASSKARKMIPPQKYYCFGERYF